MPPASPVSPTNALIPIASSKGTNTGSGAIAKEFTSRPHTVLPLVVERHVDIYINRPLSTTTGRSRRPGAILKADRPETPNRGQCAGRPECRMTVTRACHIGAQQRIADSALIDGSDLTSARAGAVGCFALRFIAAQAAAEVNVPPAKQERWRQSTREMRNDIRGCRSCVSNRSRLSGSATSSTPSSLPRPTRIPAAVDSKAPPPMPFRKLPT